MDTKLEDIRVQLANLGRTNLWFLCKGVLSHGISPVKNLLTVGLHREMCAVVESTTHNRKLLLVPRGTLKTTVAGIGRPIQRLLQDPTRRILLACNTMRNAQRRLRRIQRHFEANPIFRWLYPEVVPDFDKVPWNANEMTVRRSATTVEPSVDIAGVGTAVTGRHYTDIVKDDIVDDKNTNTPELIEDTIEWDASTIPLFDDPEDPSNEEVVIGTPWHRADLYSLKSADPEYLVYIRHALEATDGTPDFSAGLPIFPERLSRDRLEKIRDRIANDELFFCQYMCDPRGGEASQFRREWIQTFDGEPEGDLTYALTVDPGSLRPDDGDFTAYVVCAVDVHSNLYVVHRVAARHNPREIINTIFDIYAQFQLIHSVGIEEVAYQKTLQFFAQEEMRRRGVWLPFVHLHTDTRVSKEMRIRSMIPRFSNLSMFIRPHMMDLKNQLLDFPKGRHDDLIDALAYQLQLIRTPQVKVNVVVDPFSLEEILKELADRKHGPGTLLRSNLVDAYVQPVRMYDLKDVN